MKRCPLCGASCFDDMSTCYCCMNRFDSGGKSDAGEEAPAENAVEEEPVCEPAGNPEAGQAVEGQAAAAEAEAEALPAQEVASEEALSPEGVVDEEAGLDPGPAGKPPCFAFGPTIEALGEVGDCIRIDIPLRAISMMLAAARAAEAVSELADLPPVA